MQQSSRCSGVAIIGEASTSADLDRVAEARVGVVRGVGAALHGDLRELLGRGAELVHVARRGERVRGHRRRAVRDLELPRPGAVGAVVGERDLGDARVARGRVRDDHDVGHAGRDRERRVAGVGDERGAADVGRVEPARVQAHVLGHLAERHLQPALGREAAPRSRTRRRRRAPGRRRRAPRGCTPPGSRTGARRAPSGAATRTRRRSPPLRWETPCTPPARESGGSMRRERRDGYARLGFRLTRAARRDPRRLVRLLRVAPAATARPSSRSPGRAPSARAARRDPRGGRRSPPTDRPARPRAAGTVAIVSSSGSTVSSSSHANGVDTWPPTRGARAPGREHGLVRRVLVVVDEHARAALLLPPGPGAELGPAALELAGEGDRGGAHLVGVPAAARGGT